jgi:hypothetical protein
MRAHAIAIGHLPSGPSLRASAFQKDPRLCVDDAVRSDPRGESPYCNMQDRGVPVHDHLASFLREASVGTSR